VKFHPVTAFVTDMGQSGCSAVTASPVQSCRV